MLGSLKQTIENRHKRLLEFAEIHPDVWELADAFAISARGILTDALQYTETSFRHTTAYMCWRSVYDYQEESLFLLINNKVDEGYALLRMASELSRDAARICESDQIFELWNQRKKIKHEKRYKKIFRFNRKNPTEKYVYGIYNLGSDFGIHGHQTGSIFRSDHDIIGNGNHVAFRPTDLDVLDSLTVWFFSFFPLQDLASRGFEYFFKKEKSITYQAFLKLQVSSADALKEYTLKNKELKDGANKGDLA